jgi:hypothetical protein
MSKYESQKQYEKFQKHNGLSQVTVWVPTEKKDDLKAYAKRLRAGVEK